jgi:hypothetical protein
MSSTGGTGGPRQISYANVAATLALVVALGGVSWAGTRGTGKAAKSQVPKGAISFFGGKKCPDGYKPYDAAAGRYIVGVPSGGAAKTTVGTALSDGENRAVGQHTHVVDDPGHLHAVTDPGHLHGVTDPGHVHVAQAQAAPITGTASFPGVTRFHADQFDASGALGTMQVNSATTGISIQPSVTGVSVNPAQTGISLEAAGSTPGTNAPYIQLRACKKG